MPCLTALSRRVRGEQSAENGGECAEERGRGRRRKLPKLCAEKTTPRKRFRPTTARSPSWHAQSARAACASLAQRAWRQCAPAAASRAAVTRLLRRCAVVCAAGMEAVSGRSSASEMHRVSATAFLLCLPACLPAWGSAPARALLTGPLCSGETQRRCVQRLTARPPARMAGEPLERKGAPKKNALPCKCHNGRRCGGANDTRRGVVRL